ncbi:MAG: prephenate dehydratase domain-containing protein [Candidatus Limiplasma sp.]|nr:prephenate dehydratase domain-containing protein [Candidatus Limiplasma sp.]
MDINESREKINQIDDQLIRLFEQRMEAALEIAKYKQQNHLPVYDPARERQVLLRQTAAVPPQLSASAKVLYSTLFDLSRSYQHRYLSAPSDLPDRIRAAVKDEDFPAQAVVACQGVEGAYSQQACEKLFDMPNIMFCKRFEGVFQAIESGLCRYGVLPIENSAYGSVDEVYDLMRQHRFYIVRSIKVKVNHQLMALPGTKLSDIREVVSHSQAIGQCGRFLKTLPDVKITPCENTAAAAKLVSQSGRRDLAAIASPACAELYGLVPLQKNVCDTDHNFTRFICIAREIEIYPGANRMSLMLTLPHKPGSLYRMIARFAALGLNLTKLESRPLAGTDFEFQFYFDLEASVRNDDAVNLVGELSSENEDFTYLGSYLEV